MAISKEVFDELLKGYKGPDDLTGPEELLNQLMKALVERVMRAEITDHLGYEKGEQGPMEIEVPIMSPGKKTKNS